MAEAITAARSVLDDGSATRPFWTDVELRTWINDGVREIARTAEVLLVLRSDLIAVPTVARYALPADVIRLHRIEFAPNVAGGSQIYQVELRTYDELDQIWGIQQNSPSSYPSYAAIWGTPGNMTVQFYPVPSQAGTFNLFYYGMPVNLNTNGTQDSMNLNIPAGWDDMINFYVEYRARRKAKDPSWQEAMGLFQQEMQHLVDVTRSAHDNPRYMQTSVQGGVPGWLAGGGDW